MKPKSPRIVELFNEALTLELTVVNTYFLNARMLDNWGFTRLGKVFYDLSIGEMKDADAIIQRILFLDGHPNLQRLRAIQIGENAVEMLELARDGEYGAVEAYNAASKECHDLGDHASGSIFEEMARDEEHHADYFEGQLDAVMRVGLENYLAAQMAPGEGPAAE
jgi:bacterioferritin